MVARCSAREQVEGGAALTLTAGERGSANEVFWAFLKLGLTSFGGPIAHLGYFRDDFVVRRRWIDEAGYADLVALCQFLPGPASSQVGFALGLRRAGPLGALAAWVAFTGPSMLLMLAFAFSVSSISGQTGVAAIHGLKLVAVAIVAHAVWGMARTLTPDVPRAGIAIAALAVVILADGAWGQVGAILLGAASGFRLCRGRAESLTAAAGFRVPPAAGAVCLSLFVGLFVVLPLIFAATGSQGVALFDSFYRAGALVFGGGHVVLPLLQAEVVGPQWIDDQTFLAGYGAAQALPGPLFAFAAYLGAVVGPTPNGVAGAAPALVAVFLPGFLILVGALPFWDRLRTHPRALAALRGVNAAVVGILAAALYDPVWTNAVLNTYDVAVAAAGFLLLALWRVAPWIVVAATVAAAIGPALI